ncbi:hypothetical protein HDU91_002756, partial [Kappamyces sp. JEL0680]
MGQAPRDFEQIHLATPLAEDSFASSSSSLEESRYGTPISDVPIQTTNTVEAAMNMMGHHHQFNQLFNFVNHIDQIELEPLQSQKIIIAFLPDLNDQVQDLDATPARPDFPFEKSEETHDYVVVNGTLFFVCFKDTAKIPGAPQENDDSWTRHVRQKTDSKLLDEEDALAANGASSSPDFQSVLSTDIAATGLIFDDCIIGGTYFKDFTVNNRSEIELFWILNTVDLSNQGERNSLRFTDYDSGELLDFAPIPAYSPKRIRVAFKPKNLGEFNYDLQIENQNDSGNILQTRIHATVRSVLREESLVISTGNFLDFGDCVAGLWKKKTIVLRNVSEYPIEIAFGSDSPTEVVFQLRGEETHSTDHPTAHRRRRVNSRQTSDLSFRSTGGDEYGEGSSEKHHKDRVNELLSTVSRTQSEISMTRTRSSSSSLDSDPVATEMGDVVGDLTPGDFFRHEFASAHSVAEDKESHSSMDPQFREGTSQGDEIARIEEMLLRPGIERVIDVCYLPGKDEITPDYRACRLVRRNFRLFLSHFFTGKQHEKEKSMIQCVARSCTSAIEVSPAVLQFGDTDVGTLKSAPIFIKNCSDLPAIVELRYISKVLSSIRGELVIPSMQSLEVKIDIYPRKVNPDYRKEITVANLLNPENDQIIDIRSTNIDQQRITFHSLFYHILTPQATNFIDFGSVVANSPVVRTFLIENVSQGELVLELESSMPEELQVYCREEILDANAAILGRALERKEKLLESIEGKRKLKRPDTSSKAPSFKAVSSMGLATVAMSRRYTDDAAILDGNSPDYLDLASPKAVNEARPPLRKQTLSKRESLQPKPDFDVERSQKSLKNLDAAGEKEDPAAVHPAKDSPDDFPKLPILDLLNKLEKETGVLPPHFTKFSSEERFVKLHQNLRRELSEAIHDKQLVPVTQVRILPQSQQLIVLVLNTTENRIGAQGKSRKHDAKLFVKMIEFDKNIKNPQFDQFARENAIPIREVLVRTFLSTSIMELGQKHINFGKFDKTERRTKKIVIRNKSETPLLYSIKKSGSTASGDILFTEGQRGVVRGYSKKEVEFIFDPSLPGNFQEKLIIENVLNPKNNQEIVVKANIVQQASFNLGATEVHYGVCLIDQVVIKTIDISNPSSKTTRMIELRVDTQELRFPTYSCDVWFAVDNTEDEEGGRGKVLLSEAMEKRIEELEQKLKIAIRKGKPEKEEKIKEELKQLRLGKENDHFVKGDEASTATLAKTASSRDLQPAKPKVMANSIIIPIKPRGIRVVKLHVRFARLDAADSQRNSADSLKIATTGFFANVYANEQKNTDIVKKLSLYATVCFDHDSYLQQLQDRNEIVSPKEVLASPVLPLAVPAKPADVSIDKLDLSVELALIDLGRLELGESKDCYFILMNSGKSEMRVAIETPESSSYSVVASKEFTGIVPPDSTYRVDLQIIPRVIGRTVLLVSVLDAARTFCLPVRFHYYTALPSYLGFSEVSSGNAVLHPIENKSYELDLQYCYLEPLKKYAKVVSLPLENITNQNIYFTATSNLSQQCLIFKDPLLETTLAVEGSWLGPNEKTVVYIAIQPGTSQTSNRKHDRGLNSSEIDRAILSETRSLIGGIRFTVFVKDDATPLFPQSTKVVTTNDGLLNAYTHSMKFRATFGQSVLETSLSSIDFGSSYERQTWTGGFWISNGTPKMPLEFELASSSSCLVLATTKGSIQPQTESSSSPNAGTWIGLSLTCTSTGFVDEVVTCTNTNNASQTVLISVRAFIDPNVISIVPSSSCVKWDNIYVTSLSQEDGYGVVLNIQKNLKDDTNPLYEQSLEIQNTSEELIHIQALASLPVPFRWVVGNGAGFVVTDADAEPALPTKYETIGPKLLLHSKQKATAVLSVPRPQAFSEDDILCSALGKRVGQTGTLLFRNIDLNSDIKVLDIAANYCVSIGSMEPSMIDLGKVGHNNQWQEVKFQASVMNSSAIPLVYDLDLPDCISISSQETAGVDRRKKIPGESSQVLEFTFNPRQLTAGLLGQSSLAITFINMFNPQNRMDLAVKFVVTQFELKFDRLTAGELVLPPLTHPSPANALPCDNWFTITNVSDHDVRFELGCTLAPEVSGLVLLETFSRVSNSPITSAISLIAKGTVDVKVRMSPLENVRLTSSSKYLTNPDGITLGTFWVQSKSKGALETEGEFPKVVTERFPIRGALIEGRLFSLSEKSLVFRSMLASDSDEEEAAPKSPMVTEQSQSVSVTNLSATIPLDIKVTIEYPIEFSNSAAIFTIHPLDENSEVTIQPGDTLALEITLHKTHIHSTSDDIKVSFVDKASLIKKAQSLSIKFVEDTAALGKKLPEKFDSSIPLLFDRSNMSPVSEALPYEVLSTSPFSKECAAAEQISFPGMLDYAKSVIELKGCKKGYSPVNGEFDGFYELDLGQQDISPNAITKKLSLEVAGSSSVSYRVFTVSDKDSSWINIGKPDGVVDVLRVSAAQTAQNNITLNFIAFVRGSWSTYLIIENLDNPLDTKFVRVSLEVVAKQNTKRTLTLAP